MTNKEFAMVCGALRNRASNILDQRAEAYATDQDRLANFKEMSNRAGITQLQVVHLFLQKGLAVLDKIAQGKTPPGEEILDRFADALNYVQLMYAVYVEQTNQKED